MSLAVKLVTAIANGRVDDQLETIGAAVAARRRALVEIRAASINVHDTVRFCHSGKPYYLKGAKAKVLERLTEGRYDFLIQITSYTGGKYTMGKRVRVPAAMIEKEE